MMPMRFLDTSRVRTRLDERVVLGDGIELSVDLYLPAEAGRYPVLLHRTPADNNRYGRTGISEPPAERWKTYAARGYIVAAADVRGRGDSPGGFTPFVHEGADGAATIGWLRTLVECNGRIGLLGSGYAAFCAWAAACADGQVDAVVSVSPFGAIGDGLLHQGGALRLDWLFWMHLVGGRSVQPANVPPWRDIYRHWPLETMDVALGRMDIWWRQWLKHLDPDETYWAPLNLADPIASLNVPSLHITGWWDGQAGAAEYYWRAARRSRAARELIIGPWDTAGIRHPAPRVGGFDFGPRSVLELDEEILDFLDIHLRGREAQAPRSPVRIFVTGRNEWVTVEDWPARSDGVLRLHLAAKAPANTRRGGGILSVEKPKTAGRDVITDNPDVPVEFQPQFVSFAIGASPAGFLLDQAHVTARDEALVYTSPILDSTVTVIGRPTIVLTVRTEAEDADVYVLLSDSFPHDARDLHLCHGALRLAWPRPYRAGSRVQIKLKLGGVAHDFLPGHCIRITVVSSLFPLYARNPHSREYLASAPVVASVELQHEHDAEGGLALPLAKDLP
jgi:putative CocE/NonD family hydrolase